MQSIDHNYYLKSPLTGWSRICRVQIFSPHPEQITVILSELSGADDIRLRNAIAEVLPVVVQDYRLNPEIVSWVEHYPENREASPDLEFWQIHPGWSGGSVAEAYWTLITEAQVESLIGQPFFAS